MNWTERVYNFFTSRRNRELRANLDLFADTRISRLKFSGVLFLNICDILTDLANDTEFSYRGRLTDRFRAFRTFFDTYGQMVLNRLLLDGFAVIDITDNYFYLLDAAEYNIVVNGTTNKQIVVPVNSSRNIYVMKSPTFASFGKSDRALLDAYLQYADNVLNASSTANERMGVLIAMSPESNTSLPTDIRLTKAEKDEIEKDFGGDGSKYGILRRQKSFALFPRPMRFQTISLATIDNRLTERLRICVLAIADRLKVPANQIAFIDSNSNKSLANGGELHEGDRAKYKSFRRLLNATFWQFATNGLGLIGVDYKITGEPIDDIQ